ncbi:TRAP transporter small permease [Pseudalkalibacillus salsuginis]|uniref:TRAP transporter small permease n=1 Tax=Pseudalkalibacillus salsuginis TaxID=2910972 RepID=UPI001F17D5E6|nr:TRAP transporter small permease subunit [Pseudalkalibacillus salsuginis]MCF6411354.1 TRAP transporter small permease subunit [Pseudalkalibacillus salsuginis]
MVFNKIDAFLGKLLEVIITICLSATVVITFLQVIFRYVLKQPLSWSQEALMISFVYSVLFGAALAIKNRDHLTVDMLENAPKLLSKILEVLEFIVVGIVIVVLLYFGYLLVMDNFASGQVLGILPIQKAYVYLAVPLSALFMIYYHVKKVFI